MRAATFLLVLAIHVVFFLLFAVLRSPTRPGDAVDAPATTLIFLPEVVKPVESVPAPAVAGRTLTGGRKPGSQPTTYWRLRGANASTPRYWNHMTSRG
jgi:hypothetical protein